MIYLNDPIWHHLMTSLRHLRGGAPAKCEVVRVCQASPRGFLTGNFWGYKGPEVPRRSPKIRSKNDLMSDLLYWEVARSARAHGARRQRRHASWSANIEKKELPSGNQYGTIRSHHNSWDNSWVKRLPSIPDFSCSPTWIQRHTNKLTRKM